MAACLSPLHRSQSVHCFFVGHRTLAGPPAAFPNSDGEMRCPSCHDKLPVTIERRVEALLVAWARHQLSPAPPQPRRPLSETHIHLGGSRARATVCFPGPELMSALWFVLRPSQQGVSEILSRTFFFLKNWKKQAPWLQTILQSYSNQDSMVLAQKQKYRSMEQDRKPTD